MLVVDTSAWIEWLIASPTGKVIEEMIPSVKTGSFRRSYSLNWQNGLREKWGQTRPIR